MVDSGHAQVVEHLSWVSGESSHGGGDALAGSRADESDGEASEPGGVFGSVSGSDAEPVLVEGVVEDVVEGLDGPVSAVEGEESLRVCGLRGVAGDAEGAFDGGLSGLLEGDGSLDEEGLSDVGEVEMVVEFFGGSRWRGFRGARVRGRGVRGSRAGGVRRRRSGGLRGGWAGWPWRRRRSVRRAGAGSGRACAGSGGRRR